MLDSYPLRVRENILPLSVAGTLPQAFKEWFFTEKTHDHDTADATCELCGKEEIRYHFEIENEFTHNRLWVGSHCILKFGLSVYDDGAVLSTKDARKKLDKLTKKMQLESCIKALESLAAAENNDILKSALEFYKLNKYLTPKFAFVVFWRLDENDIDYRPSFFKVSLRRQKYKDDLSEMPTSRVHKIWKALSPSQRELAVFLGHSAPR